MRSSLAPAATLLILLFAGRDTVAGDHLVARETVQERLRGAAAARDTDLAAVRQALSRPEAAQVAQVMGADLDRLKAAAATLSEDELRDLAQRARSLDADPVAGLSHDVEQLLIIFLLIAIVILVLQAVD